MLYLSGVLKQQVGCNLEHFEKTLNYCLSLHPAEICTLFFIVMCTGMVPVLMLNEVSCTRRPSLLSCQHPVTIGFLSKKESIYLFSTALESCASFGAGDRQITIIGSAEVLLRHFSFAYSARGRTNLCKLFV